MKFLKNLLIIVIALGLLIPYLPAQAITPKGLIGGFVMEPIKAGKDAAHIVSLTKHVGVILALSLLCLKGIATNVYGSCLIELEKADQKLLDEAAAVSERKLTVLGRILDFLDEIAYQLFKRVIMDRLVDAFVQWIQNGGKGSVIGDWGQFFDDAANIAAGEFVRGLGAGFLCSPFNLHVQLALIPVDRFSKVTCSLNQIIGNINSFMEDFRNGSWLAYQETWYPRNNFYGGTIIAVDEAARVEAEARNAAEKEAVAGRGFLSWTVDKCIPDPAGPYSSSDCKTFATGETVNRYKKIKEVKTPGSVTADSVTHLAVVTPITRLIHSEDLTAYITAVVDASANVLTKQGIKWLANTVGRNAPPRLNAQFPCANLTADAFKACMASVNAEKSGFSGAQSGIASATTGSLSTRSQLAATFQKSIDLQTSYVEALDQLITSGKGSGREQELADEQQILDELTDKLESNQSFIGALTQQQSRIESITPSAAVTEQDYLNLGNTANTQYAGDEIDATQQLLDAQKELEKIKEKVNSKLPGILSQLPSQL